MLKSSFVVFFALVVVYASSGEAMRIRKFSDAEEAKVERRHHDHRRTVEVKAADDEHFADHELQAPNEDDGHRQTHRRRFYQQRRYFNNGTTFDDLKMGIARLYLTFEELWHSWKAVHGKKYESHQDERHRFRHFVDNYKFVQEHNERFRQGLETYDVELNQFADMPSHEVKARLNGYKPSKRHLLKHSNHAEKVRVVFESDPTRQLPTAVDWTNVAVTEVKDQGNCGCCWAFSTTGAVEGQYYMKSKKLVSLSEQNLIDCSSTEKYGNEGCNGGVMDEAFMYIKDNGAIDTETTYPFEEKNDTCRYHKNGAVKLDLTNYVDIPSGDEAALLEAVAVNGPVSVAIDASHKSFQYYTEGVYSEARCGNDVDSLDHAVLVVGYGVDSKTQQLYWLVKNSWSDRWGEKGYVRIARNKKNMCGIATAASYPQLR